MQGASSCLVEFVQFTNSTNKTKIRPFWKKNRPVGTLKVNYQSEQWDLNNSTTCSDILKGDNFLKIKMTNNMASFRDSFYSEDIGVKSVPFHSRNTQILCGFGFVEIE